MEVNMRMEITSKLGRVSANFEDRLFEEVFSLSKDDEDMEKIKEEAEFYAKRAVSSAYYRYFRYKCEKGLE